LPDHLTLRLDVIQVMRFASTDRRGGGLVMTSRATPRAVQSPGWLQEVTPVVGTSLDRSGISHAVHVILAWERLN